MLKALFFSTKIALLIAVALWVAERPGHIRLEWLDYVITMHMGLFLLLGLAVILLSIFIYQFLKAITGFPSSYNRYRDIKNQDKGYAALTRGLSAIAAGDTKTARIQARHASKLLPSDQGLSLLLQAQAARLDGQEEEALQHFVTLLENKDASFLGIRGLLQAALDRRDDETAGRLIERALTSYPKQPWLLTTAYALYIRTQNWNEARHILKRAEKLDVIDSTQAQQDRAAMLLAEAQQDIAQAQKDGGPLNADALKTRAIKSIKQAQRIMPSFAPATLMLVEYYQQENQNTQARKILEKAWKTAPHEAYITPWNALLSQSKTTESLEKLKYATQLIKWNDSIALAHIYAGQAATQAGLWGEARGYFEQAEILEPSAFLYRLWAVLEERSVHDDDAAKLWLEKAVNAAGGKTWVCRETGQSFEHWQPVTPPHGAFNTLEWTSATSSVQPRLAA